MFGEILSTIPQSNNQVRLFEYFYFFKNIITELSWTTVKEASNDIETDSYVSDKPRLDKPRESYVQEAKQEVVKSYEPENEIQIRTVNLKELLI